MVASDISRLPQQLLVLLLQHVEPAQRLSSCALVCQAWRTAAAIATVDVQLHGSSSRSCRALSAWLQSHPSKPTIDSIILNIRDSPEAREDEDPEDLSPVVLLPVQQLKGLRHLYCSKLSIASAPAAAPAEPEEVPDHAAPCSTLPPLAPFFTPDLAGLTHLELRLCPVELQGLQHLTALQHLVLVRYLEDTTTHTQLQAPADSPRLHTTQVLCEALPKFQHLTELRLMSPACTDAVMQHLSTLHRVKVLLLDSSNLTAVGLQALPTSLLRLSLIAAPSSSAIICPSATPNFSQMSALDFIFLQDSAGFDTALLASWPRLRVLGLHNTPAIAAPGQLRFQALAEDHNPHLRELHLEAQQDAIPDDADNGPVLSGRELYALTAPSGLTSLTLGNVAVNIPAESYIEMFAPLRHLPFLLELQVGLALLTRPYAVQQMVARCPGLRKLLWEHGPVFVDNDNDIFDADDTRMVESLRSLVGLSDLQHLAIGNTCSHLHEEAYEALGALTQLTYLKLTLHKAFNLYNLHRLMPLTHCRTIKVLLVRYACVEEDGQEYQLDLQDEVRTNRMTAPRELLAALNQCLSLTQGWSASAILHQQWLLSLHYLALHQPFRKECFGSTLPLLLLASCPDTPQRFTHMSYFSHCTHPYLLARSPVITQSLLSLKVARSTHPHRLNCSQQCTAWRRCSLLLLLLPLRLLKAPPLTCGGSYLPSSSASPTALPKVTNRSRKPSAAWCTLLLLSVPLRWSKRCRSSSSSSGSRLL